MIMIMMIMIRTITLSCSLSFVLVFAFLFSPFLQSQIWDVTPISKNAIFSPARTNATEANSCIRFRASNSGTQKKTHGISWHLLGISGWELLASWWSFWGGLTLEPSAQDPFLGPNSVHLPFTTCASQQKKWLQSHRTWCHCNVKMDSFVKISSRIFWMTYKWWTQEGGGNLEFREEQEVSRSTRKCCESCPTRRGSGGKFPPLQKWLPKRQISGFGHLGGEKMYRSFKSTQFVCNDVTT